MNRPLPTLLLALLTLAGAGPRLAAQTDVTITVEAPGCGKSLTLYRFNGVSFDAEQAFAAGEGGKFTTTVRVDEPVFRYVGTAPNDALPVIVGGEAAFSLRGQCGRLRNARVAGSPLNAAYGRLKQEFTASATQYATAARAWQRAVRSGDAAATAAQVAALGRVDSLRRATLEWARAEHPLLGRVASLNTFQTAQNHNQGRYPNELDYFVNEYFQYVDYADPAYGELPWTYEGNRQFAATLAQAIASDKLTPVILALYDRWPGGSAAQFYAMSGGFSALAQRKHPSSVPLAEAIVDRYQAAFPGPVAEIARQALSLRSFAVGAEAPLFTGRSPEGEDISLESLRGKIVLIDFWASWCGPCRKENPNVVRVYNEFRDRGFEILGVSLDRDRGRWVGAIEHDKLDWLHVSDLKGWKSEFSRLYGVNSIPHTVLVDRDGNILARNLRGQALEQKLREVFSSK